MKFIFLIFVECPLWDVPCIGVSLLSSSLADSVSVNERT